MLNLEQVKSHFRLPWIQERVWPYDIPFGKVCSKILYHHDSALLTHWFCSQGNTPRSRADPSDGGSRETRHLDPVSASQALYLWRRKKAGCSWAVSGPASTDRRVGSRCVLGSFLCAAALWWPPRGPSREGQWQKKTQVAGASVRLKTHIPPTLRSRVRLCDLDVWHVGQWSHGLGHNDARDRSVREVTDELTTLLTGSSGYILINSLGDKSSETAWCLWWWLDSLKEKPSPYWLFLLFI